jgi:hypothetical protein
MRRLSPIVLLLISLTASLAQNASAASPTTPAVAANTTAANTTEPKPTTAVLAFSAFQSFVVGIVVGPPLALFGTAVPKAVIVIQAMLQFGYLELVSEIIGADMWSVGQVLKSGYVNVFGAFMLIIASLHREEINIFNKALLTGRLLIMPVVETTAAYLFSTWAKW